MKVLVTGGAGFLGSHWLKALESDHECIGVINQKLGHNSKVQYYSCDLTKDDYVQEMIQKLSPDLVIHTAALTDVDGAEKNPDAAQFLNVHATENLVKSLKGSQTKFVHISTDQLYDGKKQFYKETDELSPINIYGKTKAQAEEVVRKHLSNHLILRTNFYGRGTKERMSFYDWCQKVVIQQEIAYFYSNVFYSPIFIDDLIQSAMNLLTFSGTFNLVGNERISKAEFGLKVAKSIGASVDHILIKEYTRDKNKAQRPLEMSLDNTKLLNTHKSVIHSLDEALVILKQSN
jgi:dTDP-4-dehydrorhamnose reductase